MSEMNGTFRKDLERLINSYSIDAMCETPDFILADCLCAQLSLWKVHVSERDKWFGNKTLAEKLNSDESLSDQPSQKEGAVE